MLNGSAPPGERVAEVQRGLPAPRRGQPQPFYEAVRSTVTGALFMHESFTLTDEGHMLYGLHPGDTPDQPGLYVTSGRTVIDFTAAGQRTVTRSAGQVENVCTTFAAAAKRRS